MPEQEAKEASLVVFQRIGNKINLAVLDPANFKALKIISDLEKQGYKVKIFVGTQEGLNQAWKSYTFVRPRLTELTHFIEITQAESIEFNDLHEKLLTIPAEDGNCFSFINS